MYKTYRFRLYPNKEQETLICKTFGCARFIYNYFLNKCKENKKYIKAFDMCKEIKELVITYPWLKEIDSCALRCAVFNLEDSFKNFFNKRSNYPVFKNRYNTQSYRTNSIKSEYKGKTYINIEIDLIKRTIKLPKLGELKIRGYRKLKGIEGKIINATVIRDGTEKYYVSVVCEIEEIDHLSVHATSIVGIDLGIKNLITLSDGKTYNNDNIAKLKEKRLKRIQRKLSRQEAGSKKYKKTKKRLATLHKKIKNTRHHNIINIVNEIANNYDIVVSEKLEVKDMLKNHRLASSIENASFNKICNILKWKCKLLHKYYYQIDTYYPSSKICSHCGYKTDVTNNLSVRKWECKSCHNINDRDINASINIMFEGIKIHYRNLLQGKNVLFN